MLHNYGNKRSSKYRNIKLLLCIIQHIPRIKRSLPTCTAKHCVAMPIYRGDFNCFMAERPIIAKRSEQNICRYPSNVIDESERLSLLDARHFFSISKVASDYNLFLNSLIMLTQVYFLNMPLLNLSILLILSLWLL